MLSIARALMTAPRLLVLDEPTEGLAPVMVEAIAAVLTQLKAERHAILLVEQHLAIATRLADEILVIGKGRVRWRGGAAAFAAAEEVKRVWLGV